MQHYELQEKSACGVGFVINRLGQASNAILQTTLQALRCQEHRGGCDVDFLTADGSGIMTDIPFKMLGFEKGEIAVASIFLPQNPDRARRSLKIFEEVFDFMGLEIKEYREIPMNKSILGKKALASLPPMLHAIIKRPDHCRTDHAFDKLLYLANMFNRMHQRKKNQANENVREFFFNSLSANTIVYKGLVTANALSEFYLDLQNPAFTTRFGLFHRRFSTNTVSTWDKAQPFRLIGHNGEINTIAGNRSNAFSREKTIGLRKEELLTRFNISDSGSMNEMVEAVSYRSSLHDLEGVMSIMMPPADLSNPYYKFWSRAMEPWDGPALVAFCDGKTIGARLDRNGFRPCRWAMTEDHFYLASEAGSFGLDESKILKKGTLNAGTGISANLETGEINFGDPSQTVVNRNFAFETNLIPLPYSKTTQNEAENLDKKYLFSYSEEDLARILQPMISTGKEAIGSMGDTARLAIFSDEPRSFFDFFFQSFAQVTNPPLDFLREKNVTDLVTYLGKRPNIFAKKELIPPPRAYELPSPILSLGQMEFLRELKNPETSDFQNITVELDMIFLRNFGKVEFENQLKKLADQAIKAIHQQKAKIIILTDRKATYDNPPIHSLLALRAVSQGLTEAGIKHEASIVIDTAETRTTHDIACLIGFGATAVCPYLALEMARFEQNHKFDKIELSADEKEKNLLKAYENGLLKIMSKMGISVARSYQSSKLFSIVGLHHSLINRYFLGTTSYLGGLDLENIVENILQNTEIGRKCLENSNLQNNFLYREDTLGTSGERHSMTLQRSKIVHQLVRDTGFGLSQPELFNEYLKLSDELAPINVRHLFDFRKNLTPISLEKVEPAERIWKRFGSGAMSFGAISAESQKDIVLAMRDLAGRSNSGEGGENPYYFTEGISAQTKQVASGRFGVTALYLASGKELQIKIAQGAKPGEGGQLMGVKVTADIARARFSNKNIDLISPAPMHDIYSIEDLKQLIYELKQICPEAEVNVKLVSGAGIGTIAVGVAKAGADIIDVVGGDGGTGAAGLSSMKHAGLAWEFGLVEVHQALLQNDLRSYVKLRTDGGLFTGKDIVMAALMGAEEFNFGKLLLVAEGCIMARICEKNTCPAGITTHDPVYKAKYKGSKDHVIKMIQYLAEDVRRHLARLGFEKLEQIIGRMDLLTENEKAEKLIHKRHLDLSFILGKNLHQFCTKRNPFFEGVNPLNEQIVSDTHEAITTNQSMNLEYSIHVTDRAVLATVAGEIARKEDFYRKNVSQDENLKPYMGELNFTFRGSAGQGFGVFMTDGISAKLYGEANDSVCKSMSGGKMVILPNPSINYAPEENVIIGNCALYGATGGVLFVNGIAGDRFAVRNSGAYALVEGVGLHACEYMTNGKVIILGEFYQNLGSGMTGGEIYLYKPKNLEYINTDYVSQTEITDGDLDELMAILLTYIQDTDSPKARQIWKNWAVSKSQFVRYEPSNIAKKKKVLVEMIEK